MVNEVGRSLPPPQLLSSPLGACLPRLSPFVSLTSWLTTTECGVESECFVGVGAGNEPNERGRARREYLLLAYSITGRCRHRGAEAPPGSHVSEQLDLYVH